MIAFRLASFALKTSLVMAAVPTAPLKSTPTATPQPADALYVSSVLNPPGEFTKGIEGPAVDRDGALFVVNLHEAGTVGIVAKGVASKEAFRLPAGSIGNALRFDSHSLMFIADYKNHIIFSRAPGEAPKAIFHDDRLHQPNDLTIAFNGEMYASDPDWKKSTGALWHFVLDGGKWRGVAMKVPRTLGTVNGIDLSPDDHTLYVSESTQREIWSYHVDGDELKDAKRLAKFSDFSLDGLRTDVDGKIYATRIEKGTIAKLDADGKVEREIQLLGKNPSNLAFGGPDGRTVYVSETEKKEVETFRVDRPGREWCLVRGVSITSCGKSP